MTLKILECHVNKSHFLRVEDSTLITDRYFERYSPDSWFEKIGNSYEEVFNCDELEALFQASQEGGESDD